MKIANVKSLVAKLSTVGLVAAACVLASPAKANAQVQFGVGVHFGGPVYRSGPVVVAPRPIYAPPVYGYGYGGYGYAHPRFDPYSWQRHEYYVRHEHGFYR